MTTDTAPWWFVALLAGGLTLASTMAGALISSLSARASDKRRALQEDRKVSNDRKAQWAADLRHAVVEFIVEARDYVKNVEANYAPANAAGTESRWVLVADPSPVDIRPAYQAYWNLVLLSDPETSGLARNLLRETRRLESPSVTAPRLPATISAETFTKRQAAIIEARGALAERVIEIAVPEGSEHAANDLALTVGGR